MKRTDDTFKKLQHEWYRRLAESGFEDIETLNKSNKLAMKRFKEILPIEIESNSEYYRCIGHHLNDPDTVFLTEEDRLIMTMHGDGAKLVEIIKGLKARSLHRNRMAIRFIIRRYEVKWRLMNYPQKCAKKKLKGSPLIPS